MATYIEMDVTPELAQEWMGVNIDNRPANEQVIAAYAADMKAGRWRMTAEGIKLVGRQDDPRKLLDGQNRLRACQKAGVPFRTLVVFELEPEAQESMDSGIIRQAGAQLHMSLGALNANIVASIATIAMKVEAGTYSNRKIGTRTAVQDYAKTHLADMQRSAAIAAKYAGKAMAKPSIVGYTHYVLSQIDMDAATALWRDAAEKVGLESGDPVLALINLYQNNRIERRNTPLEEDLAAVYRVWNARRQGKPLTFIRRHIKGKTASVPKPDGLGK